MNGGLKALKYAEDQLHVHQIYADAVTYRNGLDETLTELSKARDIKRDLEFRLADREQVIASEEYGKHPDMAQWRMDKHLKAAFHADDEWRELREQIGKAQSDIEGLEYDKSVVETDIKIAVSRLNELGGYLQYLAAIKEAETAEHSREAKST